MLSVAITGTLLERQGGTVPSVAGAEKGSKIASVYLPMMLVQCGLAVYVSRVGLRRNALPILLGRRWHAARRAFGDVALAACLWLFIAGSEHVWMLFAEAGRNASVGALLPATPLERWAWLAVACSVGFCEELVYRGYLQTQLAAWTRSAALGVMLAAVLFGLAHANQGLAAALRFTVYGLALGAVARWRTSLLPGIIAHVAIDLAAGLAQPG